MRMSSDSRRQPVPNGHLDSSDRTTTIVEQPFRAAPRMVFSVGGCEVVRVGVSLDFAAEVCCLHVRIPEVDPRPDASFEHLVRQIGEAMEGSLVAGEPAA